MRKCAEISSTSTYCLEYYAKKRPDRREILVLAKKEFRQSRYVSLSPKHF